MGERPGRGPAGGIGDARERGEHPPGENPSSQEAEHEQACEHDGRDRAEAVERVGAVEEEPPRGMHVVEDAVRDVAENDDPDGREHQDAGEHEKPGVAEGELEAGAQPGRSIHRPPRYAGFRIPRRCGSRRRAPWR